MIIKIYKYIRSVQFFITILTILGIVSIIGIIIPQGWEHHLYLQKYGKGFAYFLIKAGWHHIFSSLWFIIPLTAFSLNLVLCIYNRFVFLIKTLTLSPSSIVIAEKHEKTVQQKGISLEAADTNLKNCLKKNQYCFRADQEQDTIRIIAQKGKSGLIGSMVLHIGLIILLAGGIIQYYRGELYQVILSKGEKVTIDKFNIQVCMHKFSIVDNKKGELINYQTILEILDRKGNTLKHDTTQVNSPLKFRDLYFYQVHYGSVSDAVEHFHAVITDSVTGDTMFNGHIPYNEKYHIDKHNISVLCNEFLCDFVFDMNTRAPFNRSKEHNNPALKVTMFSNDSLTNSQWIFLNFPVPHGSHGRYNCRIKSYNPSFYSGIEIRKKPGTPYIWIGIISITIGVLLVFLFPFRQLFLNLKSENDLVSLVIASTRKRPEEWFAEESEKIIHTWKEGS